MRSLFESLLDAGIADTTYNTTKENIEFNEGLKDTIIKCFPEYMDKRNYEVNKFNIRMLRLEPPFHIIKPITKTNILIGTPLESGKCSPEEDIDKAMKSQFKPFVDFFSGTKYKVKFDEIAAPKFEKNKTFKRVVISKGNKKEIVVIISIIYTIADAMIGSVWLAFMDEFLEFPKIYM